MARSAVSSAALLAPLGVLALGVTAQWLAGAAMSGSHGPMTFLSWTLAPSRSAADDAAALPPPATTLLPLSPLEAEARNALIPFSPGRSLYAASFRAAQDAAETPAAALKCLTQAVYYEAGNEPLAGKRGVAQVVINRWASPLFPKTVCGVVFQGAGSAAVCQFTFACDGAMRREPAPAQWAEAEAVARDALAGYADQEVGGATHYHADYVVPAWATTMFKLVKLGRHIFYRWPRALIAPGFEAHADGFAAGPSEAETAAAAAAAAAASNLAAAQAGPQPAADPEGEALPGAGSGAPALPSTDLSPAATTGTEGRAAPAASAAAAPEPAPPSPTARDAPAGRPAPAPRRATPNASLRGF